MNMDISTLCLIPSFKCHSGCLYLWLQSSFWTKTTALIDSAPYSPPLTTYFQHTDHQYSFHTLVFLNWWCLEWQMTLPLSALQINYRNTTAGHFFATTLKCYLHCRGRKTICVKIGTELKRQADIWQGWIIRSGCMPCCFHSYTLLDVSEL